MITIIDDWDRNPLYMFKQWMLNNVFTKKRYKMSDRLRDEYVYNWGGRFSNIHIETINRCNNNCSFCAASIQNEQRNYAYMDDLLYEKVCSEIELLGYQKLIVTLNTNNEPLLDKNIVNRIKRMKEIPNIYVQLETNGKLLDYDKLRELLQAGLDFLTIDDYADNIYDYVFHTKNIRNLKKQMINFEEDAVIRIVHRLKKQRLSSRSGKVHGQRNSLVPGKLFCDYPFTTICINPKGDVHICCRDVYYDAIVGNLINTSLLEIWNGKVLNEIRKSFIEGNKNLKLCKKCTSIGSKTI